MAKKRKQILKPGDVVRSLVVMVDFGRIELVPGQYGIICGKRSFDPEWFDVHWHGFESYRCTVGRDDVELAENVASICASEAEAHGTVKDLSKCGYCDTRTP